MRRRQPWGSMLPSCGSHTQRPSTQSEEVRAPRIASCARGNSADSCAARASENPGSSVVRLPRGATVVSRSSVEKSPVAVARRQFPVLSSRCAPPFVIPRSASDEGSCSRPSWLATSSADEIPRRRRSSA